MKELKYIAESFKTYITTQNVQMKSKPNNNRNGQFQAHDLKEDYKNGARNRE